MYELLTREGIEAKLEVVRGCLCLEKRWFMFDPPGWVLNDARVYIWEGGGWRLLASSDETPLVAVVHTPGGVAEGVVKLGAGRLTALYTSRLDYFSIVLGTSEPPEAILAAHTGPGIRYYAVYPPCSRILGSRLKLETIAVSLDAKRLEKVIDTRVRIEVDSHYDTPQTPIILARVGEGPIKLLVAAHICHPKPGSHDNASGVAVAYALAKRLSGSKVLREKGVEVLILIVPEYTGTSYALDTILSKQRDQVIACLSVDMVGADLVKTGGFLRLTHSLYSTPSPLDPYLHETLVKLFEMYRLEPYEIGSDHDIATAYSIPSSMLNEWPDRYYHTNLDKPNNLDPDNLAKITEAVAKAIERLATIIEDTARLREKLQDWLKMLAIRALEKGRDVPGTLLEKGLEYTMTRIAYVLGKMNKKPWENIRVVKRGPISRRYLLLEKPEGWQQLTNLRERKATLYLGLAPLTLQATGSLQTTIEELKAHGEEKIDTETLKIVEKLVTETP